MSQVKMCHVMQCFGEFISLIEDLCFLFYNTIKVFSVVKAFGTNCIALGRERACFGAFRTFVRFVHVWFCLFPLPLGVWEAMRFVIVTLPGHFSYPVFLY